jgi:Hfq protein
MMMTNYALNENSYLQSRVDDQMPIFCYLQHGTRLVGILAAHDIEAIFIRPLQGKDGRGTMMVMKAQISSIVTASTAHLYRGQERSLPEKYVEGPSPRP